MMLRALGIGCLLTLLLAAACARRQTAAVQVPAAREAEPGAGTGSEVVLAEEPSFIAEQRDREVRLLIRDARMVFELGRDRVYGGRSAEAMLYFDEALSLLTESGFRMDEQPLLEEVYQELTAEALRLKVLTSAEFEEPPFPLTDELAETLSPLDEIASLDLYAVEVDPSLEGRVSEDLKQTPFDFPIVVNEEVLRFLDYYQGRGRKITEEALQRSGRYLAEFRKVFADNGLPQDLVYMAHVESLFKPNAYSRARARGIWQFMAGTARLYGLEVNWWLDERMDVRKSTLSAARMLKDLKEEFGDWYLVLAAYNVGKGRVARALKRHGKMDYWTLVKRRLVPRETRNFVPSILAAMIIYKNPTHYGFHVEPDPPLDVDLVPMPFQVDLKVIAETLSLDPELLEALNPELLRGITPADSEDYQLKVPAGKGSQAGPRLAELPPEKRIRWAHHKVRQGETLSLIASRFGVSIRAIADMNKIRNIHRLKLGQELVIPLSDHRSVGRGFSDPVDPNAESHIVRSGDSIYLIARRYGVRMDDLFRWNNLGPRDTIHPGQEIRLSEK